jgi:hypothetical protein
MYFSTKSYLKNTRNHTAKHALIHLSWLPCKTQQPTHKSNLRETTPRQVE